MKKTGNSQILLVAILGKTNEPIYLKIYEEREDEMDLKMMAFSCLDHFKEKSLIKRDKTKELSYPCYQGKINHMFTGDCEICFFGYFTNTGHKFILGMKATSTIEEEVT